MSQAPIKRNLQYHHEYHQCLVYKTFNASKPTSRHGGKTWMTFQQTLDVIEQTDRLMRGVKQIVYLTGWQYEGHDSKWPAWFEVNPRLARPGEPPLESLRWLIREARERFNAIVSVHLNMCDAYNNSPLWQKYLDADVIERNADGTLNQGSVWDGEQSYRISKTREWQAGLGQERIDRILELLPLADQGTVHIDVFYPRHSLGHGISQRQDIDTILEIIRYWHDRGVDVTKEWFDHEFAGYIPMVWHYNLDEIDRINYPQAIVTGGGSAWNKRSELTTIGAREKTSNVGTPSFGCLFEEAWGHGVDKEPANVGDAEWPRFVDDLYARSFVYLFLNSQPITRHVHSPDRYEVHFQNDIRSVVRKSDRKHTIHHGDRLIVDGGDVFIEAGWREREIIAYSRDGSSKEWQLPPQWRGLTWVKRTALSSSDDQGSSDIGVEAGNVRLHLRPGESVVLAPI